MILGDFIRHPLLSAKFVAKRIKEIPSKGLPRLHKATNDDFDRKYGVETAKMVQIVPTRSPNFVHGVRYSPPPKLLSDGVSRVVAWPTKRPRFIDVGCGKGRVLIVAAAYPFKRIRGVEYSPQLAAICRTNLAK